MISKGTPTKLITISFDKSLYKTIYQRNINTGKSRIIEERLDQAGYKDSKGKITIAKNFLDKNSEYKEQLDKLNNSIFDPNFELNVVPDGEGNIGEISFHIINSENNSIPVTISFTGEQINRIVIEDVSSRDDFN